MFAPVHVSHGRANRQQPPESLLPFKLFEVLVFEIIGKIGRDPKDFDFPDFEGTEPLATFTECDKCPCIQTVLDKRLEKNGLSSIKGRVPCSHRVDKKRLQPFDFEETSGNITS